MGQLCTSPDDRCGIVGDVFIVEGEADGTYEFVVAVFKESSLVAGQSQQLLAGTRILRNPEDSGVNTGIPVPQEFL